MLNIFSEIFTLDQQLEVVKEVQKDLRRQIKRCGPEDGEARYEMEKSADCLEAVRDSLACLKQLRAAFSTLQEIGKVGEQNA